MTEVGNDEFLSDKLCGFCIDSNQPAKEKSISKAEREKTIVAMYNNWHSIDDIWKVSGFSSRSSVFRILNEYGVSLNRGKFSGPLGKRKPK